MPQNAPLSTKKRQALAALLETHSVVEAARVAGVGRESLRRWMKEDAFQEAYKAAQAELFDSALVKLKLSTQRAIDTLLEIMSDPGSSDTARVRCAQVLLGPALR